jgi:hypothetical protein
MLHVTVKDGERALLTRNGRLERVLEPGRHRLFDPRRELTVEVLAVVRAEFPSERHAVLKAARPDLAAALFGGGRRKWINAIVASTPPRASMAPWQTRYSEGRDEGRRRAHRRDQRPRIDQRHLRWLRERNIHVTDHDREPRGGPSSMSTAPCRAARPGRHAYGRPAADRGHASDPRPRRRRSRPEMLTKDRIALRVTLTYCRIVDPERRCKLRIYDNRTGLSSPGGSGRRAHARRGASARARSTRSFAHSCARIADSGIEVMEHGVKDLILPARSGAVNKVVEAERRYQPIRR